MGHVQYSKPAPSHCMHISAPTHLVQTREIGMLVLPGMQTQEYESTFFTRHANA